VVIEATYGWYWVVDLLQELGARVHLANPKALNWGDRRVKNDVVDATDLDADRGRHPQVVVDTGGAIRPLVVGSCARRQPLATRWGLPSGMSTNEPESNRSEDHEFPIMELFNAEDAIEHPGEPLDDLDPTDDSDAPAP
jgi:hypothetical protein